MYEINLRKCQSKEDLRSDSRRTQLIRIAKKIPLKILEKAELKSRFKTLTPKYYMEAYFNWFIKFLELLPDEILQKYHDSFLQTYGDYNWAVRDEAPLKINYYTNRYEKYPAEFFKFWETTFPKSKLISMFEYLKKKAKKNNPTSKISIPIDISRVPSRTNTSKRVIIDMIGSNDVYRDCVRLVFILCKQSKTQKVSCLKILNSILRLTDPDSESLSESEDSK